MACAFQGQRALSILWITVISMTWWKEKTRPQWGGVAANRTLRSKARRKGEWGSQVEAAGMIGS